MDAVLGYSLAGAPHGVVADLIEWMSLGDVPVVAVGDLWVADIGIPAGVLERAGVRPTPAGRFTKGYRERLSWSS